MENETKTYLRCDNCYWTKTNAIGICMKPQGLECPVKRKPFKADNTPVVAFVRMSSVPTEALECLERKARLYDMWKAVHENFETIYSFDTEDSPDDVMEVLEHEIFGEQ